MNQTFWKLKVSCHKILGARADPGDYWPFGRSLIFLLCCTSVTDLLTLCGKHTFGWVQVPCIDHNLRDDHG
ncbi:hypothetical protein DPEC_G00377030 [Dallia pectoralis]|nr:hypothetical protein DPEC_G00377030 [Dallia pectoralis]